MRFPAFVSVTISTTLLLPSCAGAQSVVIQNAAPPHHEVNYESERQQADILYQQKKLLEALPLYQDLRRQDSTVALFAARYGESLLAKEPTITDQKERFAIHTQGIVELRSAQGLGDNSLFVRNTVNADSKTPSGAILAGIPLSIGYTYHGTAAAQPFFAKGEAAFHAQDWAAALTFYTQAASADPAWYDAALYAGDSCFRMKDALGASTWFVRATAIDPGRETAWRYWGDTLFHAGDANAAREKFVEAVVAEPYGHMATFEIAQWAKRTGHQLVTPAISRPEFTTPNGELKIDPTLASSTLDGRSSWIVYQQYRVAHGARILNQTVIAGSWNTSGVITPNGYEHTIAEEHAALRAMLADIDSKIQSGALSEANLDTSLRNIRNLEHANVLGAWIAINAADAGIVQDYPQYRDHHRQHLVEYINTVLIR